MRVDFFFRNALMTSHERWAARKEMCISSNSNSSCVIIFPVGSINNLKIFVTKYSNPLSGIPFNQDFSHIKDYIISSSYYVQA